MNNSTHFLNKKNLLMITHILAKMFLRIQIFTRSCWLYIWMFQPISPPWCYGIFKPSTVLFDFNILSVSVLALREERERQRHLSLSHHGFSILTAVLYSMTVWSQSPSLISSLKCFSAFFRFYSFLFVMDDWEMEKIEFF